MSSENVSTKTAPTAEEVAEFTSAKTKGASRAKTKPWGGTGLKAGIAIAAILTIAGIVCWGVQLAGGMVQTNMRNMDSWGLYITNFMFFVGLSAGGLIISSIPNAFGMKGFGGISKVAIWTSICCTCVAIGFVVVDLGGPARLWELFVYSNLSSPLMWDILVLGTYLILSIVYLWAYLKSEAGKVSHTAIRVISVIALVVAILVHSVTAWIFSLAPAHEFWHTALMGPWFVVSALDCGTALVLIVCLALRRAGYLKLEQENIVALCKMLIAFVLVDLYFYACDLLTSGYFGGTEGGEVVAMLTTGALAPFFWCQIACMALAVVILCVPKLRTAPCVVVASLLVIAGVFCKRAQILLGGFQVANLDMPGVATSLTVTNWENGIAGAFSGLVYWPSALEFGVTAGVIALGALMLLLGIRYLKLKPAK